MTGEPLAGVRIATQDGIYADTVTSSDGRYRLTGFMPGTYRLSASKDDYAFRWIEGVELKAEGAEHDIDLTPAAILHLEVTDRDGRPAVGRLYIGFIPQTDEGQRLGTSVMTDGNGRAVYRQGLSGEYDLSFTIHGIGNRVMHTSLRPGEQHLRVQLE